MALLFMPDRRRDQLQTKEVKFAFRAKVNTALKKYFGSLNKRNMKPKCRCVDID